MEKLFLFLLISLTASASAPEVLRKQVVEVLESKYPGARIEFPDSFSFSKWEHVEKPLLLNDSGKGLAHFRAKDGKTKRFEKFSIPFAAWMEVPVANHRILPRQALKRTDFTLQTVNFAEGSAHPFRGLVLRADADFKKLEARQTILAGQFPLLTAVEKIPDIRRGEPVQLLIRSGVLTLTTPAVAQEKGTVGERIRVLSKGTKREMTGVILAKSKVEVTL